MCGFSGGAPKTSGLVDPDAERKAKEAEAERKRQAEEAARVQSNLDAQAIGRKALTSSISGSPGVETDAKNQYSLF